MITPEEYIKKKPYCFFIHGLDLLDYVLKGRTESEFTAYGDQKHNPEHLRDLKTGMSKRLDIDPEYYSIIENSEFVQRKAIRMNSDVGELDIDRYLDKEEQCFIEYRKEQIPYDALTILIEIAIPYAERYSDEMKYRHREAYKIAVESELNNRPCRVLGVLAISIPEIAPETLRCYVIIKDFNDPIFPGIWGALQNNSTTNDLWNVMSDYLIGTECHGNGLAVIFNPRRDFSDDEELVSISSKRLNIPNIDLNKLKEY